MGVYVYALSKRKAKKVLKTGKKVTVNILQFRGRANDWEYAGDEAWKEKIQDTALEVVQGNNRNDQYTYWMFDLKKGTIYQAPLDWNGIWYDHKEIPGIPVGFVHQDKALQKIFSYWVGQIDWPEADCRVTEAFLPTKGWIKQKADQCITREWLTKFKDAGFTQIQISGADFGLEDLLK
jgi:hypothetical protein